MDSPIRGFSGEYRWLSNFWPVEVYLYGEAYPTVEHGYQAAKCVLEEDRLKVKGCKTPGGARRAGKHYGIKINPRWDEVREVVMLTLLRSKFNNPDLRNRLLATGNRELIEENYWGDTFWGVCRGEGKNTLGRLLMFVRTELRTQDEFWNPIQKG